MLAAENYRAAEIGARPWSCDFHPTEVTFIVLLPLRHADMAGSKPQTHQRSFHGTAYIIETSQHEKGISIVVTVPGIGPEEENDRTYSSEAQALIAGEELARTLIQGKKK
jgi:hypothetical protein